MRALNERTPHLLILSPVKSSNVANLYDKNILFMRKVIESYERSGGENVDYFPVLNDIKSQGVYCIVRSMFNTSSFFDN